VNCVADENVDASIVNALRAAGHEVWSVSEETKAITDEEVLRQASDAIALLLTSDKDFGDLVFRQGKANAGVLLLRLAGVPGREKARLVTQALQAYGDELRAAFSVLTRRALRIRKQEGPG